MEKQDWLKSYREIEEAACKGDAGAQFQLGELYFQNTGIPPEEASKWFWKAAEQGHAGAQCFLGIYFLSTHACAHNGHECPRIRPGDQIPRCLSEP